MLLSQWHMALAVLLEGLIWKIIGFSSLVLLRFHDFMFIWCTSDTVAFPIVSMVEMFPFDSTEGYISPRTKHMPKWWWGEASKATRDARRCLLYRYTTNFTLYLSILIISYELEGALFVNEHYTICHHYFWSSFLIFLRVEAETLRHLSAKYDPMVSKVNYCSSIKSWWKNTCFYTVSCH